MDIGNQQRVIIVELEETPVEETISPAAEADLAVELAAAAAWPLPLDLDPEPVS